MQERGKRRSDVGHVQVAADLLSVGTERFAARQQALDHGSHQALRVLSGAELKENAAPRRRQTLLAAAVGERWLQGKLAFGIGRHGFARAAGERTEALVAELHAATNRIPRSCPP